MPNPLNLGVICFKGAKEISEYIREDHRCLNELVADENLPAFKRGGAGPWRALNIDLDAWLIDQRKKYIRNRKDDAEKESA